MKLNILYEDKNLIVCFKPSGVPSQSDKSFDTDMVSAVLSYESIVICVFMGVMCRTTIRNNRAVQFCDIHYCLYWQIIKEKR